MSQLPENTLLLEASWEVANKVGGIYTVLATKARHAREQFGELYFPVGPYTGHTNDFLEKEIPEDWKGIAAALEKQGISFHFGTWEIAGKPVAILLGWEGLVPQLNALKSDLWERFKLDTLGTEFWDVDQPLLWSIAVGRLATEVASLRKENVLLHAHEWLAGTAILSTSEQVHTVFTTHATVMGRALSNENIFIYDKLDSFDADAEAARLRVTTKHQIERLAAQNADVFTTVSSLTAREAASFLKTTATVVENGLDLRQFPTYDELVLTRAKEREKLDNFVSSYFFPTYRFALSDTKYFFTMGRYEYGNKGYDLALEALCELDKKLRAAHSSQTVIAFFFVPGDALKLRADVAKNSTAYSHIADILDLYSQGERRRIEREVWDDVECSCTLLPESARDKTRRLLDQIRTDRNPPVSPFDLRDPDHDPILKKSAELGLCNTKENRVKVVFFPVYLEGFDGALNQFLYDLVASCDLGIFSSKYEPWGYTPMESLVHGTPAVTSNLAGFGQAAEAGPGMIILDREKNDRGAEVESLTNTFQSILSEDNRTAIDRRIHAYKSVTPFDWQVLYPKYIAAYQTALKE